ncbi:hypothetical protein BDP81DRAFT_184889 [Colletotrichum phormii]|uniref:Uncharacterized protein n=1 Tax=Colletotrichum phormii TaxID=359342 RepID=A0AAJ0EKB9_9PEZI|nr:uncharacterized protein BDP81DRAFT_184889 [Colletotrichum phormii]KAK1639881.1 hypothetical protein BDP81DRAFT_184889 [Colletotrichum phormii]
MFCSTVSCACGILAFILLRLAWFFSEMLLMGKFWDSNHDQFVWLTTTLGQTLRREDDRQGRTSHISLSRLRIATLLSGTIKVQAVVDSSPHMAVATGGEQTILDDYDCFESPGSTSRLSHKFPMSKQLGRGSQQSLTRASRFCSPFQIAFHERCFGSGCGHCLSTILYDEITGRCKICLSAEGGLTAVSV